jgi:hypothetical protein
MGKLAENFLALINRSELPMNARQLKRELKAREYKRYARYAPRNGARMRFALDAYECDERVNAGGMTNARRLMAMPEKSRQTR